ncbi:hypothetical protein V6Z11_A08G169600 [Gossypium hirsutum]
MDGGIDIVLKRLLRFSQHHQTRGPLIIIDTYVDVDYDFTFSHFLRYANEKKALLFPFCFTNKGNKIKPPTSFVLINKTPFSIRKHRTPPKKLSHSFSSLCKITTLPLFGELIGKAFTTIYRPSSRMNKNKFTSFN